ncbi:major facilitator superfamily domain-containing protein [Aspergillus ambiguus]|uniref:MFS transporter n=1 Tax=Aspergillus ambiguus TaxID=176160 RepID=UPI003CCCBE2A
MMQPLQIPLWRLIYDKGAVTQEIIEATYDGSGTEEDPSIVSWTPDDPRNPLNFQHWIKVCTALLAITAPLVVAFGSSIYAGGLWDTMEDFHCSREVAILGISLFVLGFGVGPMLWGPLSEVYGRRLTLSLSLGLFTVFSAAAAGTQTIYALVILRFFASSLGSAPWAVTSGILSDTFPAARRGLYGSLFTGSAFFGPALGPIRPFVLLFREPIILLMSTYLSVLYGILYLFFDAFPFVFQDVRGWGPGLGGLSFVGVFIGTALSILYLIPMLERYKKKALVSPTRLPPEERLPPAFLGSILIPISLFWFAWTNSPSIHWMAPIAAGVPFGFGIATVFMPILNYLIDSYTIFAASALAGNCFLRANFACAFPLFTRYMYQNLGIHWASCIPAFLALVCTPIPFIFYRYGAQIRMKCHYSAQADAYMRSMYTNQKPNPKLNKGHSRG